MPRSGPLRSLMALALFSGALLGSSASFAHPQFVLNTVNRYSRLVLLPHGHLRLIYTVMVGDDPAFGLRQSADRNGDHRLDADEARAMARDLADRVQKGIDLQGDGQPLPVHFDAPVLAMPEDDVSPRAFSVELGALITLQPGREHRLRYDDRASLDPPGEVEILIDDGLGVRLVESYQGAARRPGDPDRHVRFQFYGPLPSSLADRSVSLRFRDDTAASGLTVQRSAAVGVAVLLCALGLLGAWQRARRATRGP